MNLKLLVISTFSLVVLSQSQGVERNIDIDENYSHESHFVTTPDGYILKVFRIYGSATCPPAANKTVVFLQHGFLSSAADWVIQGPGKSLPYLLVDKCYDVWIGNARGNTYSRAHTTLDPDHDAEFWQFGWHEIAIVDLPTVHDFILAKTGQSSLHYIGHSQGNSEFFAMESMLPSRNNKIKSMHALAPSAYIGNLIAPFFRVLAPFQSSVRDLSPLIGQNEFLASDSLLAMAGQAGCYQITQFPELCKSVLFLMFGGFDSPQIDNSIVSKIFNNTPAGVSVRQLVHNLQLVNSKEFRQYNYGPITNLLRYKTLFAPEYNLTKVTTKVYLHHSKNDWVVVPTDVAILAPKLPNVAEVRLVALDAFSHLDFIYGKDVVTLLYEFIIAKLAADST